MNYLRGFLPWIVFAIVSSFGWQWGALAGLGLGVVLLAQGRRAKLPMDSQILEVSTVVYFATLTVPCPKCGHPQIEETFRNYKCAGCGLVIWKTVASRELERGGNCGNQRGVLHGRLPFVVAERAFPTVRELGT